MSKYTDESERWKTERRRTKRRLTDESSIEILEHMSDAFATLDREWRYTYVNREVERNTGLRRDEMLGRTVWEVFPEFAGSQFEGACLRATDEGMTVHFEEYCAPLDRWFEQTVYPAAEGITVYARDITERKRTEEDLQKAHEELERRVQERTQQLTAINEEMRKEITERERAEEELRQANKWVTEILESITDAFTAWDQNWRYIYINERSAQLLGKSADQLIGQSVWDLFPEAIGTEAYHKCQRAMRERVSLYFEAFFPAFNKWYENYVYPTREGLSVYWRDITERKHAEEEQRQLLRRLMAAQEEERRRIARQLHDQMGQDVSALGLMLSTLKARYGAQAELGEQLDSLTVIAKQLSEDIDYLVWELRPTALSDLGLVVASSNYVKSWSKHFGVHAELHTTGMDKDRLTDEVETVLYRVLQEALTNVAKHSEAGSVSILLERRSDQVSLLVEDNGVGFDGAQAFGARRKGVGLVGMRERVTLVGGAIEIESVPGAGVTIVVRIPAPHVSGREERNE